ncbi:MAG: hypothetical protein K9J37_04470 [Saprospiraceae bacterium]|nr:hypothetical protein [Saprospiraceae bacterium]MCF8249140.1 hypothetical protein [Saprospiraceae bacterium]MCF8278916.1 hypothetical protein [Bacteroidales bacterium]MCF8311269.1 hypothetical protein [Saprospiraceae bacterium]MCF8440167.1 hypothetical protein [Saprospiraceae bacterium]
MHNEILDIVEKNTGPRTCPACGHQYPFGVFVRRYVMSYGLSTWPCQGCRESIKCDFIKLQIMWLVGLVITGFVLGVLTAYFDWGLLNLILLIPYFAFVLLTLFYAKFEKHNG